jgi:hypothetical protein
METVRKFLVEDVIKPYQKLVLQTHRHYARVARRQYRNFTRNSRPTQQAIRKQKKGQLQFLRRNLQQAYEVFSALKHDKRDYLHIKQDKEAFKKLGVKLTTAETIYQQQYALYQGDKVTDRVVSFHRPCIRPIFRGKARQPTEFGPKVELSLQGNALIIGKTSYNNFYDGHGLKECVSAMKQKGYPVKEDVGDRGNQGCQRFLNKELVVSK